MGFGNFSMHGFSGEANNSKSSAQALRTREKRQKINFDTSQLAHVWAQQVQEYGSSSNSRFYFQGDTIYSYGSHFPIARFVKKADALGEYPGIVFFTTREYSVTTSGHKHLVRGALRGLNVLIVELERVTISPADALAALWHDVRKLADEHKQEQHCRLQEMRKRLQSMRVLIAHCRVRTTKEQRAALEAESNAHPQFWTLLTKVSRIAAQQIDAAYADKQAAQQLRRAAMDEAKRVARDKQGALYNALRPLLVEAWRNFQDRLTVPADILTQFAGCPERFPVRQVVCGHDSPTILRVRVDDTLAGSDCYVETSRGARVSCREAKVAWQALCRGECPQDRIGHFQPSTFDGQSLTIGCHVIPASEIDYVARVLGLTGSCQR